MKLRRIKCWLTRHHWLLQRKVQIGHSDTYNYVYKCTVCDKVSLEKVWHIGEAEHRDNKKELE